MSVSFAPVWRYVPHLSPVFGAVVRSKCLRRGPPSSPAIPTTGLSTNKRRRCRACASLPFYGFLSFNGSLLAAGFLTRAGSLSVPGLLDVTGFIVPKVYTQPNKCQVEYPYWWYTRREEGKLDKEAAEA